MIWPHPAGERLMANGPADVQIDPGIFGVEPVDVDVRWRSDRAGVETAVPYQLCLVRLGKRRTWLTNGPVTMLRNGDLLVGDSPARYGLAAIHQGSGGRVCRYEYRPAGVPVTAQIYLAYGIAYVLWEPVWDSDSALYGLFEDMGDGLELDPLQRLAAFQSRESAVVFARRYPQFRLEIRPEVMI